MEASLSSADPTSARYPHDGGLIPASVNDGWRKNPDHKPEHFARAKADYEDRRGRAFKGKQPVPRGRQKEYWASVGSPCSAKTTTLEQLGLREHSPAEGRVYLDPDQDPEGRNPRTGEIRKPGLYKEISAEALAEGFDPAGAMERAYTVNRPFINITTNALINEAVAKGYNVLHGTTGTAKPYEYMLKGLRKDGYRIRLSMFNASQEAREQMRDHRVGVEKYYQVTKEDFLNKADDFPKRHETYARYADRLDFFQTNSLEGGTKLAAYYEGGKLTVVDEKSFKDYEESYNAAYERLAGTNERIPTWAELHEQRRERFPVPSDPAASGMAA